jgi:hypothetical protein
MIARPTRFLDLTTAKKFKRIFVGMIGGTVLVIGIALIVLPGPAFLVIPAGLAILALEFAWAGRWLRKARGWFPRKPASQPLPSASAAEAQRRQNAPTAEETHST